MNFEYLISSHGHVGLMEERGAFLSIATMKQVQNGPTSGLKFSLCIIVPSHNSAKGHMTLIYQRCT